jgi:cell division septation protein DedD
VVSDFPIALKRGGVKQSQERRNDMTETPFGGEAQNRLFIIIVIGLAGLLVLGLLGIGGYAIFSRARRGAEQVAAAQTVAAATAAAQATAEAPTETPVPTFTPVSTSTPTEAATLVVSPLTGTPELTPPAPTPVRTATPTPAEGETPTAGFGGIGAILAGLALAVVLVVARKVRLAG